MADAAGAVLETADASAGTGGGAAASGAGAGADKGGQGTQQPRNDKGEFANGPAKTVEQVLERANKNPADKGLPKGRLTAAAEAVTAKSDAEKAAGGAKPAEGAQNGAKPGDKTTQKPVNDGSQKKFYQVKVADEAGKEADAEIGWKPGTVVRFKAHGKVREYKSVDELVRAAQQGVDNHNALSLAGERAAAAEKRALAAAQKVSEVERHGESLLLLSLFGGKMKDPKSGEVREFSPEEVRELLGPSLERFKDPEVRALLDKERSRVASDESTKERTAAEQQEGLMRFWEAVDDEIGVALEEVLEAEGAEAAPAFPWLTAEDANDIKVLFNRGFEQKRDELKVTYRRNAEQHGFSQEQADALAESDAREIMFTGKSLRGLMRAMNDRYADRVAKRAGGRGAGNAGAGAPPGNASGASANGNGKHAKGDGAAIEQEVRAHNERMDQHVDQRDRNATLRGPGGSPSGTRNSGAPDLEARRDQPFETRRRGFMSRLREARDE